MTHVCGVYVYNDNYIRCHVDTDTVVLKIVSLMNVDLFFVSDIQIPRLF